MGQQGRTMADIRKQFISLLQKVGKRRGFQCRKYISKKRDTKNIIELFGHINCLLYFKIRSGVPYRWGVTKTRIDELRDSGERWLVVLLYETVDNGYLLTANDVGRYIKENLWPLGRDKNKNEYKIRPGSTLQYNDPFHSFVDFIRAVEELGRSVWRAG